MGYMIERVVLVFMNFYFLSHCMSSFKILACNSEDSRALNGFLNGLETWIDGWGKNASDCCTWEGVTCDQNGNSSSSRVISLDLGGKRLRGKLSKSLTDLAHLRSLNLSHNFIGGSLPIKLFHLENLAVLDLSSNDFSGYLAHEINLPLLGFVDLTHNSLIGSISEGICEISKGLRVLSLSDNYFSGNIPPDLGNCSLLENLSLGSNLIDGQVPENLFKLQKLSILDISENRVLGTVSHNFGNLSNLVKLDISSNRFSGTLPNIFQNLETLGRFAAYSNRLMGPLPTSLSNSPSISSINLYNNSFTGSIVINCSAMISLTSLILSRNQFNGPIPHNLPSCQRLGVLSLSGNNLGGQLPNSFKTFKSLSGIALGKTGISNLSAALEILQHCRNLKTLGLTAIFHHEAMPNDENLRFENLKTLDLANCGLTGSVPTWLKFSTNLEVLDLSWNHLSGNIPAWFDGLKLIFYLDLSNNSLSGEIPRGMTNLGSLIRRNFLLQDTSQDFRFFIKKNPISQELQYKRIWSLPPSLNLSYNRLTGPIWPEIGNVKILHVLDLSNNDLSGHIPSDLSMMSNLEALDLSCNHLSGTIPASLENLSFLSKFSVAHNHLSGRIPSGGQFSTFPKSSFEGNEDLCLDSSSACSNGSLERPEKTPFGLEEDVEESIMGLPFVFGAIAGFVIIVTYAFVLGCTLPIAMIRNSRTTSTIYRVDKRTKLLELGSSSAQSEISFFDKQTKLEYILKVR